MIDVMILVCALSVPAPECQRNSAMAVLFVPETAENASGCMMSGMLYAAQSRTVLPGYYSKIVCGERRPVATEVGEAAEFPVDGLKGSLPAGR